MTRTHKHRQADRQSLESKRGEKWEAEKRRSLKFQGDTGEERRASSSSSYAGLPTTGRLISMKMSLPLPWLPYGCHDTLGAWRTFSSRAVCECVHVWGGTVVQGLLTAVSQCKTCSCVLKSVITRERQRGWLTVFFDRQRCVQQVCVLWVSSINLAIIYFQNIQKKEVWELWVGKQLMIEGEFRWGSPSHPSHVRCFGFHALSSRLCRRVHAPTSSSSKDFKHNMFLDAHNKQHYTKLHNELTKKEALLLLHLSLFSTWDGQNV